MFYDPIWLMNTEAHEPNLVATNSPWALPGDTRHDGWTGERMAKFCETLAETGLVVDACLAAEKAVSGAYALRRRNPVFAAAWEAALTIARERLADTLLARSIEGTVEQYFKDGELVGERRVIDNRLGLAILRRLDRMSETGSPLHSNLPAKGTVLPSVRTVDWDLALAALRSEPDAIAEALAMLQGDKVEEVEDPPIQTPSRQEDEGIDLSDRCWKDEDEGVWLTDFPPPPGFDGWRTGEWGENGYERACTPEETAILEADCAAANAQDRTEDEALRDAWFAMLKEELEVEEAPSADGQPPRL
jgi:hypothetical protein